MTHVTEINLVNPITINEKMTFANALSTELKITFQDIVSLEDVADLKLEFATEDGDNGFIRIMDNYMHIETNKKFENLKKVREFVDLKFDTLPDGQDRPVPPPIPEA